MRSLLLFWLRDYCWYAALDPVHDVGWMKATASHTESLRREQPAQVGTGIPAVKPVATFRSSATSRYDAQDDRAEQPDLGASHGILLFRRPSHEGN